MLRCRVNLRTRTIPVIDACPAKRYLTCLNYPTIDVHTIFLKCMLVILWGGDRGGDYWKGMVKNFRSKSFPSDQWCSEDSCRPLLREYQGNIFSPCLTTGIQPPGLVLDQQCNTGDRSAMVWHYENQTLNPTSSKSTETKTVLMNFKLRNQKPQCPFPSPRSPLNPPAFNAGRHSSFPSFTLSVEHDCLSSFLLKQLIEDILKIIYRCVLLLYVETLLSLITSGWPPVSHFLKTAAGIEKGAQKPSTWYMIYPCHEVHLLRETFRLLMNSYQWYRSG